MIRRATALPVIVWALLAAIAAGPVSGQEPHRGPAFSLALGGATGGIGGALLLAVPRGEQDLVARLAATTSMDIFQTVSDENVEFAVLYGFRQLVSPGWFRGAAGLGFVRTTRPGELLGCKGFIIGVCDYEAVHHSTLGVALQVDAGVAITRSFGLGVMAMGNVNGDRSFGIFAVSLSLGGLR